MGYAKKLFFFVSLILLSLSCSNSKKNNFASSGNFPILNYEIPLAGTASSHKISTRSATSGTNVLFEWSTQINRIMTYINDLFGQLNRTQIGTIYSGSVTLPNGNSISINLADLSNDGEYSRQALVCSNGARFLFAKWNNDKTKVKIVRDFNHNPQSTDSSASRPLLTEVVYDKQAITGQTSLHVYNNGQPWEVPADINEGPYLTDHIVSVLKTDGSMTFSGVNAWSPAPIDSTYNGGNNGDVWLVGQLNADASGSFIAHRKFNTGICNAAFTELSPNWCFGATFNSAGIPDYSILNLATLWLALESVGITSDTSLKYIEMPTTLDCP